MQKKTKKSKNLGGRPKVKESERRKSRMSLRMTDAEWDTVEDLSDSLDKQGIKLGPFTVSLLLAEAEKLK